MSASTPRCKCCRCELTLKNIKKLIDIDFIKIGFFCAECFAIEEIKLKGERFIENYKKHDIYMKDGHFVPYWGCTYYFDNMESTKARIDNNTVGYYPSELVELINE